MALSDWPKCAGCGEPVPYITEDGRCLRCSGPGDEDIDGDWRVEREEREMDREANDR